MPTENHHDDSNSREQCSENKTDVPFLTRAAFLEEIVKRDPRLDPDMVDVVMEALRTDRDLRSHFFRIGPHIDWVQLVWDWQFLSTPPEPVKTDQGFLFPRWEAQEWLISVAADVPEIVLNHVIDLSAHPVYLERALVAVEKIPADEVEQALPKIGRAHV